LLGPIDMHCIAQLQREHLAIERMIDRGFDALARMDGPALEAIIDFFIDFADGVHHTKEEQVLFDPLSIVAQEVVLSLRHEHELARKHLSAVRAALPAALRGSSDAREQLDASFATYGELLQQHMRREEALLYPLVARAMGAEMDEWLVARMAAVERERTTPDVYRGWLETAESRAAEPTRVVRARGPKPSGAPTPIDARTLTGDPQAPAVLAPSAYGRILFEEGVHRNVWLDDFGRGLALQANQYLIVHDGQGLILDPGGPKVYPQIFAETMKHLAPGGLRYVFLSHQDPDIGTSLNAWMLDTKAEALMSRLWIRFIAHFGVDALLDHRLIAIPDEGACIELAGAELVLLPAHFLHSPGNFQIYDPTSRTLFSGDLGASMGADGTFVTDFDAHVASMRPFHQRYMASRSAMRGWAEMTRGLDIERIAPQHGAVFEGREMVSRFVDWCAGLECGVDLWSSYRVPERRGVER